MFELYIPIIYYNIISNVLHRAPGQLGKLLGGKPDVGITGGPVPTGF